MSTRPLIRDPQAIPVVGTDAHLPAVDAARLQADAIRRRFASPPAWQLEFAGDGARFSDRAPAAASVLVPLVVRDDGLHVMLTQRTAHLRDHGGQVSFPGGRVEAHDADAIATALRETEEEIGIARAHVDIVGQLPTYSTVTNFVVTPVVALVRPGFTLALDAFEVEEAFEVPLHFLMNPAHHQRHRFDAGGATRQFLSMPWDGHASDGAPKRYFIWGATAAMLRNLYRLLAA
jgi:8-oxo-dGTP pyrophosphatase MutT (NUDIX family)